MQNKRHINLSVYDYEGNKLCDLYDSIADLMGHADTRMVETVYARTRKEGIVGQKAMLEEMNREYLCDKNAG